MTTIAYDHKNKTIAWDSRKTSSDNIIMNDNENKHVEKDGVHFWLAGTAGDCEFLIDAYFTGHSEKELDCNVLAYDSGVIYMCGTNEDGSIFKDKIETNNAIGSGRKFALAAMDLGKSAKDAVEYVKTREIFTGGKVHSMKLD